ncbi:MAG: carboxylating nicotinate-nucleotide diphosphorylase, partial [bacterium]
LCGIATMTRRYVDEVEGTGVTILDTRKTTPGLRALEKYAVRMGGAVNHRMGLYDGILIKENHIHASGGISEALERVREGLTGDSRFVVVVEAATVGQVREAMESGADRILLDNMDVETLEDVVEMVRAGEGPELEASGGITFEGLRDVASTGVDFISIGALTHSVRALDISLLLR